MRKAFNDLNIITNEEGNEFLGISLGYDYCSEHEWGIKGIRRDFGIPESSKKNMGVKSRTITICPDHLIFKKSGEHALLFTGNKWGDKPDQIPYPLENYKKELKWNVEWNEKHCDDDDRKKDPIVTAWSESGFGVAVKGKKESAWLEELYNAFKNVNVVITNINLMPWNPFSNSSLALVIADKLPEEYSKQMFDADKGNFDLEDYCKKIGFTKLKEKKGNKNGYNGENHFVALSPSWITGDTKEDVEKRKKEYKTKYDIIIWNNYSDDDNNYGWYIFEDIKKWLKTDGLKLADISHMGSGNNPIKRNDDE